jgi:RNA polymerase sigma-70 factor (ECF subfamily)
MPDPEDVAVERARGGDAEAFRVLVERHSRGVYRLALRVTGNCQDAEDVVQDTFLKAYRQLGRFESRASFGTWVHRIAMNCAVDLLRSRPKREHVEEDDVLDQLSAASHDDGGLHAMSPERLMASREVGQRVNDAMAHLSAQERAAFVLRHFEGLSIAEVSEALGIRDNAAKHCVFRAVRKMRLALEPFAR